MELFPSISASKHFWLLVQNVHWLALCQQECLIGLQRKEYTHELVKMSWGSSVHAIRYKRAPLWKGFPEEWSLFPLYLSGVGHLSETVGQLVSRWRLLIQRIRSGYVFLPVLDGFECCASSRRQRNPSCRTLGRGLQKLVVHVQWSIVFRMSLLLLPCLLSWICGLWSILHRIYPEALSRMWRMGFCVSSFIHM